MRKFIINFLLSTLSKKQKKQILKELKKAIKLVSSKRGKRRPYKPRKLQPIVETKLPPIRIEDILVEDTSKCYTKKLSKMEIGDITWFKRPRSNISPLASGYGKVSRKTFECHSIGKTSTEVKRVA